MREVHQERKIELNLRYVVPSRVDFRRSDLSHYQDFKKLEPKLAKAFKKGDAVMFVSSAANQILFVFGAEEVTGKSGQEVLALASLRLRITGSSWDPRMIVNYAEAHNILIANRKRYEDFFAADADREVARAEARRKRREEEMESGARAAA